LVLKTGSLLKFPGTLIAKTTIFPRNYQISRKQEAALSMKEVKAANKRKFLIHQALNLKYPCNIYPGTLGFPWKPLILLVSL
jgi:hypothetical protein